MRYAALAIVAAVLASALCGCGDDWNRKRPNPFYNGGKDGGGLQNNAGKVLYFNHFMSK